MFTKGPFLIDLLIMYSVYFTRKPKTGQGGLAVRVSSKTIDQYCSIKKRNVKYRQRNTKNENGGGCPKFVLPAGFNTGDP
jgi:hypothetical protein